MASSQLVGVLAGSPIADCVGASGLAAASAALAATAAALPACGFRAPALLRTLRCGASFRASGGAASAIHGATTLPAGLASRTAASTAGAATGAASGAGPSLPQRSRAFGTWALLPQGTANGSGGRCGLLGLNGPSAIGISRGAGGGLAGAQQQLRLLAVRRMATQAPAPVRPAGISGRLSDAARLQLAAAWQAYGPAAYVAGAVASVYFLWRFMFAVTSTFISVNEKLAEYGLMGLAVTLVLLAGLYGRWRLAVSPAAVYRQALVKLNTHPGVLEVMGAPLVGSEVRAYVVTGGGLYLSKKLRPKLRSRRIQMMFPLSGGERKGLVSLEAKRKKGKYVWKLLAVDLGHELQTALPAGGATGLSAAPPPKALAAPAAPPASRVYVIGDAAAYARGGVLGELRSPFLQALSNSRSYEVEDELEDELEDLALPPPAGGAAASLAGVKGAVGAASTAVQKAVASAAAALGKPADAGAAAASAPTAAPSKPQASAPPPPPKPVAASGSAAPVTPAVASAPSSPTPAAPSSASASSTSSSSWWSRTRKLVSGPEAAGPK